MRVTVAHNKGREGAIKTIDETVDQLFKGMPGSPVQIVDTQKRWEDSTLHFSFTGKMGIFTAPIRGFAFVTQTDVTIDVELPGIVKSLMGEEKIRTQLESRARAMLNAPTPAKQG